MQTNPLTLQELSALVPRLHATVALLTGSTTTTKKLVRAAPRMARAAANRDTLQAELLVVLKRAKGGSRAGELASAVRAERGAVNYHLRALRALKKARVKGTRGQARWFAT